MTLLLWRRLAGDRATRLFFLQLVVYGTVGHCAGHQSSPADFGVVLVPAGVEIFKVSDHDKPSVVVADISNVVVGESFG